MFDPAVGSIASEAGIDRIYTRIGAVGHALYGPYKRLPAGRHIVEFGIELAKGAADSGDLLCGFIDVVANSGQKMIAYEPLFVSQLSEGTKVTLAFDLAEPAEVEYRVHVNGLASLCITDDAVAYPAGDRAWTPGGPRSVFIENDKAALKRIYEMDVPIRFAEGRLIIEIDGVRFNARNYDDINFVREIFELRAYNLLLNKPTCIIDIGMNVALASLQLATKDFVKEIHAFEPFEATRARGQANIALNPALSEKISVHPCGLGDRDGDLTLRVRTGQDSGAMTTLDWEDGTPMQIPMRDAGRALKPIIESARSRGLEIVVKVDCEGSEFAVFASLAQSGLIPDIRGFMVEWHDMLPGRNQNELIAPLLASGYVVFDTSPRTGNGFFYAVR